MRFKAILTATILVVSVSVASAQISATVGAMPIFGKLSSNLTIKNTDISLNDDLGVDRSNTFWEGWAGIYTRSVNLRGYYLFPKNVSGTSLLPASLKDKDVKTDIPIETTFGLKSSRVEIGIPLFNDRYWFLEPFFIYHNISPSVVVQGKGFNYSGSTTYGSAGMGVNFVERITRTAILNAKFFVTSNSTQFDTNLTWVSNNMFCGVGYTYRVVSVDKFNLRLSGPQVEIGMVF